jgi:hypothetical protein
MRRNIEILNSYCIVTKLKTCTPVGIHSPPWSIEEQLRVAQSNFPPFMEGELSLSFSQVLAPLDSFLSYVSSVHTLTHPLRYI